MPPTRTLTTLGLLAFGLLALGAPPSHARAASSAHRRHAPPPGSYVVDRVTSMAELNYQVAHYPRVRSRFARFFGIPQSQVPAFVATNLATGRVPRTKNYTISFINRRGRQIKHTQRLHRGVPVFVLRRTGQPVLNWNCGNLIDHNALEFVGVYDHVRPNKIALGPAVGLSPNVLAELIMPTDSLTPLIPLVPDYPISPFVASSGHSLLPLLAVGLVGLAPRHHATPAAVPEPGAGVLLLAGLPLLGAALRRRTSTR